MSKDSKALTIANQTENKLISTGNWLIEWWGGRPEYIDSVISILTDRGYYVSDLKPKNSVFFQNPNYCKYIKRIGESCTANNNCVYPNCKPKINRITNNKPQ